MANFKLRESVIDTSHPTTASMLEEWWINRDLLCPAEELRKTVQSDDENFRMPDPCNLVYPGIYLGGERAARDILFLKSEGVTHVLNAASGPVGSSFQVSTSRDFYRDSGITYLGLELYDTDGFSIHRFFQQATDFIHQALQEGGKVLVHCKYGISRSATLVATYLMMQKGMRAKDALRQLKNGRSCVKPNHGFLKQLSVLDHTLFAQTE